MPKPFKIFTGSLARDVDPWVARWVALGAQPPIYDGREGYLGDGVLGARAGPQTHFENVAHEMAHALEALARGKGARLCQESWGLTLRKVEVMGQIFDEPNTMQPTELECRVAGIQRRILEMVGAPCQRGFTGRMAKILLNWMPDHHQGGLTEVQRLLTRRRLIVASHCAWPADRVLHEWARVAPILASAATHAIPLAVGCPPATPPRRSKRPR